VSTNSSGPPLFISNASWRHSVAPRRPRFSPSQHFGCRRFLQAAAIYTCRTAQKMRCSCALGLGAIIGKTYLLSSSFACACAPDSRCTSCRSQPPPERLLRLALPLESLPVFLKKSCCIIIQYQPSNKTKNKTLVEHGVQRRASRRAFLRARHQESNCFDYEQTGREPQTVRGP
jgi:hypothetical protein